MIITDSKSTCVHSLRNETIKALKNWTPFQNIQILTTTALKWNRLMLQYNHAFKRYKWTDKRADPGQTAPTQSDLGLDCLFRPTGSNT